MLRLPACAVTVLALVLTAACGDDDPPTVGGDETLLVSPATVTGLSGAEDSQKVYRIVVPAGATEISVTTAGGTGDVDLYIRAGERPTPDAFDCASNDFDNDESCVRADPDPGDWFITLLAFLDYSGVTLTVTVTRP